MALNRVWGVRQNRSYLHNQAVSLGLAFAVGVLAMASVASTASQQTILTWVFFDHTDNLVFRLISYGFLRLCAGLASILLFFLIYWVLPYRKVPARAVLPTAVVIGLLWQLAKVLYIRALPWLDFQSVYGPFYISVGLMMWAFLSGLLLLAGAHFSATRYTLNLARQAEAEEAAGRVMESPNSQLPPPAEPPSPPRLWRRLPTGLAGAAFWLGVWFCLLFFARQIPGGFGTFFGILQIFVGIALGRCRLPADLATGAQAHALEPAQQTGAHLSVDRPGAGCPVRDSGVGDGLYRRWTVCHPSRRHTVAG